MSVHEYMSLFGRVDRHTVSHASLKAKNLFSFLSVSLMLGSGFALLSCEQTTQREIISFLHETPKIKDTEN